MGLTFKEWLKLREDFHQGGGALGASLPLKPKKERKVWKQPSTPNSMMSIDRGQGVQGTKRDDGNG
jgi:hypothetical protein